MPWNLFTGTGEPSSAERPWEAIPKPPPWRSRRIDDAKLVPTPELLAAVNTALHLRRPLLLTGPTGTGKTTLVRVLAKEFQLGEPLEWHVTSHSALNDALYQYDALGRLHATQVDSGASDSDEVANFVTLGPLGTALADTTRPRAVLIDEIDKSDLDLPGDLLHVLDVGEFEIPPLVRETASRAGGRDVPPPVYPVRGADGGIYKVPGGMVQRSHPPIVVLTSNDEQKFLPPFLRRCIRFQMPEPDEDFLAEVAALYLGHAAEEQRGLIHDFAVRLAAGDGLAADQLLGMIYLVTGETPPDPGDFETVRDVLWRDLNW